MDPLFVVLEALRQAQMSSRSDLISSTGLGRAVVERCVSELLDRGLATSAPEGLGATGGRPARMLRFNETAGHLLVAEIGLSSVDAAITDLAGNIVAHRAEPASMSAGPQAILERVNDLFQDMLTNTAQIRGQLWGIGIGVPGPVDFASGCAVEPPNMPGWNLFPIRAAFVERYGVPVWVDNEVNLMALGELRRGAANGQNTFILLKLGTGIGAGIVVGGNLHRGARGCAGDVAHIQVVDDPSVLCRCGKTGCVEAVAGGAALARSGELAAHSDRSPILAAILADKGSIEASDLAWAATHGDAVSLELLTKGGRYVGKMLSSIVNVLNPALVVIGGGVSRSGDFLLAAIREQVYARSLPLATRDLSIQRSTLDHLSGITGAASMVMDELFAPDCLLAWMPVSSPSAGVENAVSSLR